jgi:hypothetical protein
MMAFSTPIRKAMITLGGQPYAIQKLEGGAADRWREAFRQWRQVVGYPPDEIAALLAVNYPRFIPWLSEFLPKYDRGLPWHEADRGELLTAFLAVAHLEGQP